MAVEPLHARADGPADVALVTLAPGAVTPWESHADAAEHLRLLSGCLCVEVTFGERVEPVDLSEVSGRLSFTVEAGVRHRLIAVYHNRPAVFLIIMRAS
jgi:quercetin dioxygenase-like cupin family protein